MDGDAHYGGNDANCSGRDEGRNGVARNGGDSHLVCGDNVS